MLKIKKLTKKFGDLTAIKDINLEIKKGEFFTLIGPNGSGKTTMIKNILGLIHPSSGDVLINNKSIKKDPLEAKKKMGYIPDEPKIWSHITGEEFLYFSGALYDMKKEVVKEKIPKLLANFDLKGVEKNYFENYSRGNKQKFTILAALLHEPDLILVDEPIVGLDPQSAETAMRLLTDFTKSGGTVFMTTHTLAVAEKHSSKVGILYQGLLSETGSIKELRDKAGDKNASLLKLYFNFSKNVQTDTDLLS